MLPLLDAAADEEDLVAEVKGQRLFELDRERLGRLYAMVALLHGPSLDDGVCMEVGYAAARGIPVLLLSTNFQTYSLTEKGPLLDFPDPLIQATATRVIRERRLGPPSPRYRTMPPTLILGLHLQYGKPVRRRLSAFARRFVWGQAASANRSSLARSLAKSSRVKAQSKGSVVVL